MATGLTSYLLAQVAFGLVIGLVLLGAGRMVLRRGRESRYLTAIRMFAAWWAGLGAAWLVWAADTLLVHSGASSAAAAATDYALVVLYFGVILLAFACLFYYLLFLYVGNERLSWAVWVVYGGLTLVLLGLLFVASPPSAYQVSGLYADTLFGPYTTFANSLRVILVLPVLVAALALSSLARRATDPAHRYRVRLISASLAFYLVMPLVFGSNPGVQPVDATGWTREVLNKVGLLVAIVAALLAYHPPAWVRRRYARPGEAS